MREIKAPSLAERTTLRLGGRALAELVVETPEDIPAAIARAKGLGGEIFSIGRGSNLLARGGELGLVLIRVADRSLEILGESGDKVLVRAGAGLPLAALLRFCIANGLGGLEGLAGVPGSCGGAVAMNAGSFGCAVADCLHEVTVAQHGAIKRFSASDLRTSYRRTEFPGNAGMAIILEAIFALTRQIKSVIFTQARLNFLEKKSRQPLSAWSAGCAFKNPPGHSAGILLDKAGFRGKRLGGMAFSSKHANFLINEGHGQPDQALELMECGASAVREKFGVTLEREVRIVPEPWP